MTALVACPKCGEQVAADTVICPRCDYILDTSFLGDDILNEKTGAHQPVASGGDAMILGGLDELDEPVDMMFSESTGSFLTADTVDVDRQIVRAPVYISKSVQELMKPEAVLAPAPDVERRKVALSPFELHVLSFIDGKRPVARLRKKTGLSSDDVRIAVGMLAEKGAVVLHGTVKAPAMKDLLAEELAGELSDSGEHQSVLDDISDGNYELDATYEDMRLPGGLEAPPSSSPSLPKFRLDSMNINDVPPVTEPEVSPWDGKPPPSMKMPEKRPAIASRAVDPAQMGQKQRAAGFFELAQQELAKGNRVRAHVYAKLAAETDPDEPKYQELLKSWTTSARAAVSPEAALFADADAAEKQGNFPKALALMEQALGANPDAAHIHNRMGLLLATRFKKLSQASEHLMKACELEPNNVVYKSNLGKIIALADERGAKASAPGAKPGDSHRGLLGKLKKAFD